jgi:dTMP kinase
MRGRFITLEGIDGAGKSTHIPWIAEYLRGRGLALGVTREPGGTALGERLRELLLDPQQPVSPETEALLMFAARNEHLRTLIAPALERGEWVLCDRFTDATFAYQGGGRGVGLERLEALEGWVQGGLQPDLTLYFDVPIEVARARLDSTRSPDRFEREQGEFFQRVREGYLARARRFPQRIRIIDSTAALPQVQHALRIELECALDAAP